ncbi:PLP-dependent aminotransferase family protein [Pseudonocardia sp. GCM10023141]|uniref:aminotransferase-like domain-containing protein n=1 Tax=Pseudonocardia sp. GCM10023141 TaxID=3252653 RepID=UPI00361400D8
MADDSSVTRLVEVLRRTAQALQPGDRLPATRALVAAHGVGPVTVNQAVAQLVAEGVIDTVPGRGTYVARRRAQRSADLAWQTVALGAEPIGDADLAHMLDVPGPDTLVLSAGYLSKDLQPLRALSAATARAARRPDAWERAAPAGLPELRGILAAQLRVEPADVVVVPGGQAGLATCLRALASPGSPVLVEVPTYLGAISAIRNAGLRPVPVPTDAGGVRVDLLARAFEVTGSRLLYMQPTYANPSGNVLAPQRRSEVLDGARAAGAFVIEDDYARHLGIDGPAPPALIHDDRDGHVVQVASLTKPTSASLRIGALVARGPAVQRLVTQRTVDDFFVSRVLQEATVELLTSPAWPRHLTALRSALRSRRDALVGAVRAHLPDAVIATVPAGGFHLWLQLPAGVDDVALAERARREDLVISAGRPYFVTEPPAPHIRLSFGATGEADLVAGVRRLARLLPG